MVRWIHKVWNVFWAVVATLTIVIVFGGLATFLFIQTETSKTFIANRIEQNFSDKYNGVFTIGKLDGLIPFRIELEDVNLYPDSSSIQSVFKSDSISASLNVPALLRNRFIVTGLTVESPEVLIDSESETSLLYALKKKESNLISDSADASAPFFEIVAPNVKLNYGEVLLRNAFKDQGSEFYQDSLLITDINLAMFFEYRKDERFVDIENLTFETENFDLGRSIIYGQVYSDDRFLEFNSFNFVNEQSYANFTGRVDGIDVFGTDILNQLQQADYNLMIRELSVSKDRLNRLLDGIPELKHDLYLTADFTGDVEEVAINDTKIEYGNSSIQTSGTLADLRNEEKFNYDLRFFETTLDTSDVSYFFKNITDIQLEAISEAVLEANLKGDVDSTSGTFSTSSNRGKISIEGFADWDTKRLDLAYQTDSLNIGELVGDFIQTTNITSSGVFKTQNYSDISSFELVRFQSQSFQVNDTTLSLVEFEASGTNKIMYPKLLIEAQNGTLITEGTIDLSDSTFTYDLSGAADSLNLKYLTQIKGMAEVIADINFKIEAQGNTLDELTGIIDLEIPESTINGDTLDPHLIYADIANPSANNKSVRITTTAADLSIEGNYDFNGMFSVFRYWKNYFVQQVKREFLFEDEINREIISVENLENQDINFTGQIKNISLIKSYFPEMPNMESSTRITAGITANNQRLLFNADVFDPSFLFQEYQADSLRTQITGSFRHDQSLKDFSEFLVSADFGNLSTPYVEARDFEFDFSMEMDSLNLIVGVQQIGEEAFLNLNSMGTLTDSTINLILNDFRLGSEAYSWDNQGQPSVSYTKENEIVFDGFTFQNQDELFDVQGTFSENASDSVNYLFRGVKLDRISDLINGKVDFGGTLNGTFTTRTLTRIPTIEGDIDLQALSLNDQVVGDFEVSSVFNSDLDRFDTNISVFTDSTIYPQYFERNDRQGQNLSFSGYVRAPVNGEFPEVDSLYYFDLDFNTIDLWIIPFLTPKVFTEMSGVASGSGKIWGNLDTYDFHVDYDIGLEDAVYMKPRFLDTYYYGQGPITFSRSEGLVFEDIFLIDPSGGMAILEGFYNFNDFGPVHNMNINIDTDEFQFLNNDFDPQAPFFGEAYGTGVVNISGTNRNPVLTTVEPMVISDFSTIELPLLEETEFNEDSKFIRFVDSFEDYESTNISNQSNGSNGLQNEIDASNLTFAERFTLDLQFIANDPMTVRLIFDQITGDVITADGTGRLRIRLEDQDLSIFGRFDINGGNYQFVSGDIFTRRFSLEPGGSIVWEGDPANARLNINAVYSARPNIRTLTTARSELDLSDPNSVQRTPVDLVLNISGSIFSIQNDFYFRLPNTFESRQNSTLSTQIAALNRNEDEKLLQATSFLLMGDFIPASSVSGATSLTENFSGSGAVLNPLISNQVISPLLSNQINSLLNSDISSFDVDFNLNTYNQVDLGLALRLYNDRIIIRRDGQLTGAQSNIGDLGATYKINRTFSVTAFHRQDPTFSNLSQNQDTQQGQDINGIGVEAEVTFNSWQEFFNRLSSPFRKIFGNKNKDEKEDENPS